MLASNPARILNQNQPHLRLDRRHRCVERELFLLDQLQGGNRGDRLDHRGDAKDGIARHGRPAGKPAPAEYSFVNEAVVGRGERHDPRNVAGLDRGPQRGIDFARRWRCVGWRRAETAGRRQRRGRFQDITAIGLADHAIIRAACGQATRPPPDFAST